MAERKINKSYRFCLRCKAKATLIDEMNNPWCENHRQCYDLMNWGLAHKWPEINCTASEETVNLKRHRYRYYAVGPEYSLWFTACSTGTDHYVETLYATVFGEKADD